MLATMLPLLQLSYALSSSWHEISMYLSPAAFCVSFLAKGADISIIISVLHPSIFTDFYVGTFQEKESGGGTIQLALNESVMECCPRFLVLRVATMILLLILFFMESPCPRYCACLVSIYTIDRWEALM